MYIFEGIRHARLRPDTAKYENGSQLVIASETKQSDHLEADYSSKSGNCFVAPLIAMTNNAALIFTSVLVDRS